MYLLDTNIIAEIRKIKAAKANPNFELWFIKQANDDLFISSIVLFELKKGSLLKRHKGDILQADLLDTWIDNTVMPMFQNRILPFDEKAAFINAGLHIPNPRPDCDSMIAATALAYDLTLVTRNTSDFDRIGGLRIFNPFS
ncbi:type II toxin-antitoxin system VapC family toxin [Moraxella marmotae]|uniref:type II toxin-antitoxin system VapC family toxin n=1 Tax=Moraxella marmotae TaxID=3344520 RepID=UPI0035D412BC